MSRPHPKAEPHGALREVLPGIHLVQGSLRFGPARFSRNMVVVERGGELVLLNSVRLDAAGLAALDALGRVTDVVRLAGSHGRDDPFYKERYGATVWDMAGMRYFEGVDHTKGATYFESDHQLGGEECPPLPGSRLFHFGTALPESAVLLPHHGGTLVPGDSLQNWGDPKKHFNLPGRIAFGMMGFVGPFRFGKGWVDLCKPDPERFRALIDLGWDNLLPAHGDLVIGGAADRYRPTLAAYEATGACGV